VPRQHPTGGKQKLLGISKRGNCYLRRLFVQGAHAVLQFREKQSAGVRAWLAQLASRTHHNVVGVALAKGNRTRDSHICRPAVAAEFMFLVSSAGEL